MIKDALLEIIRRRKMSLAARTVTDFSAARNDRKFI
jgi:hypothetical protein